ncbi:hypothetical protein [Thermoplasma volcanium GSS1]|uniref:SUF system FeS cluster assembly SufBD core domain-containing protein n=1 Tax=Thermoplasma volcanium (strain ATCC 51530 / DSM 4299 / JCM 9571 / NBRC 15438 / GSS1) TaxID=273116 RepID=Q978K0_THEVO|nr:SufD family Fe-S cluster assembly protein [Thermoplasma volcanium]BAB60557.1 hypothetical protein [Thermoplasma volcanium GSS1]
MIEQIRDLINDRRNDGLHEYRQDNFIQFMKSPVQPYKESPTRLRYVDFTDDLVEKMVLGEPEDDAKGYGQGDEDFAFVNGKLMVYNGKGCIVEPIREAERKYPNLIFDYTDKENVDDRYEYLINAGFYDGFLVYLPPNKSSEIKAVDFAKSTSSFAAKNLIIVGEGSSLNFTRYIVGGGEGNGAQGDNTYIFLSRNSSIVYSQVQDRPKTVDGIQFLKTFMEDNTQATIHHVENGYNKSIIMTESYQKGNFTNYQLRGVSFTRGLQQMDLRDNTIQIGTHSIANIYVRGIVREKSLTMHRGNIDIKESGRKAEGYYDTRILLLSKEAYANTKPALLINNNDVKSKHASAVTNIDEESLFYLRSRGIDEETAKNLIIEGFTEHVVEGAPDAVRNAVRKFAGISED